MTEGPDFALPLQRTHLALPTYAKIMGINPVHFQGGVGSLIFPGVTCSDVWPRYAWQSADKMSHDSLADTIYVAEQDIASAIGYQVAPTWIVDEPHVYPRHHRRDAFVLDMRNRRDQFKSVKLKHSKFIQGGTRQVASVGTATVVGLTLAYSSVGSFLDTATITLTLPAALVGTSVQEIKAYFTGTGGNPAWEIRPVRSKSITGAALTMVFDAWLFIDPDTQARYPTDAGFQTLDLDAATEYVTSVDVYREYNDYTEPGAILYWEQQPAIGCLFCAGSGCMACAFTTQNGCIHVRDTDLGMVAVAPAAYNEAGGSWEACSMAVGRDPDQVKLFYYAGEQSNEWLAGRSHDPLGLYLAQTIAWLATARLERPPCACANVVTLFNRLSKDVRDTGGFTPDEILNNPFGTRYGEVAAWNRVSAFIDSSVTGAAV